MALIDMIEQLSFGSSVPRLDSCLGLYLSPEVMFLAEVQMGGGRPKVTHLLRLPLPPSTASRDTKTVGSLNTDFLSDQERVGAVLTKAIEEVRWRSKHVVVTLSHHFGILRYFTLPAIDRRFWKTAVPAEAKKYIPIPFSSLSHDFQIVPMPPGSDRKLRNGALFGVTDRKNLGNISALAQKVGLTLVGVELAPCSVERLWDTIEEAADQPYAQVHFDRGDIRILISERGVPIFFREVFLGSDASAMDRRKVDLAGCVDFTKKQLGSSGPARLRLSGQIPDIEAWKQSFSQDLGIPGQVLDMDKALGLRGAQWGGYAAVGASLRHMMPTALTLDLGGVGKISDDDRRTAVTLLSLAGIFTAFFLLVGSIRYAILHQKTEELELTRKAGDVLDAFRGKSAASIEKLIADMQDKVNSFNSVTSKQVPLAALMSAIAESIPEPVWVEQIGYENPMMVSGGGGRKSSRTMSITGHTVGPSRALEQDLAFRFHESLSKHPRFKEAFSSVEQSVEAPGKEMDEGGPDAPLNPENQGAARTKFVFRCASLKGN